MKWSQKKILTFINLFILTSCGPSYQRAHPTNKSSNHSLIRIKNDATAITGQDIFTRGCDPRTSASDHAPVLNRQKSMGTWNIASRASNFLITDPKKGISFYNHKFKSVNNKIYFDSDRYYKARLSKIAKAIDDFFRSNSNLQIFFLQEVPKINTNSKINPRLFVDFFENEINRYGLILEYDLATESAVVKRSTGIDYQLLPKNQLINNATNPHRFATYCSKRELTCSVNLHAKPDFDICIEMESLKKNLKKNKPFIKNIVFVGDFNESAERLQQKCATKISEKGIISTYAGKGQSCKDNSGNHNPSNIDLFIFFK